MYRTRQVSDDPLDIHHECDCDPSYCTCGPCKCTECWPEEQIVYTQRFPVEIYKVTCDNPYCNKVFYDYESIRLCPHCATVLNDDNLGEQIEVMFEIDTRSGRITKVSEYERRKKWWLSIGRDDVDYRSGDLVLYKGQECYVVNRYFDCVDLDNGIGVSRHSDELRLSPSAIEKSKIETNNQ